MKACPHCHRQNGPERKFCAECGADLQGGVDQGGVRHTPVPPGTVFEGKYEILSELGRGGMGVVYRGKDLSLERQVAIKVLPEKFNTEPEVIERFQREAKAMASLDHPNIIPVYAIGQQDNFHYFAMKYLDGETIAQTLERLRPRGEAFSPSVVQGVIVQVCKGLAHAHRQGLIHRDIKPGNIMLSETGHVTIMDFGIVKKDQNGDDENNLTKTGLVFGTPEYMAPEQAQGLAPPGPTTDLYAVGIVAYEMLTGRPPFEGGSPFSIVFKHIKNPPAPLVDRIPDLNPAFEGLVFKSLEKDPKARYQSAEAMYKAFEAFSFHAPHPSPASGAAVGAAAPLHAAPPAVPAFKLDNLNFDLSGVPLDDEDPGLSARRAAPPGVYAGGPPQAPGAPRPAPSAPPPQRGAVAPRPAPPPARAGQPQQPAHRPPPPDPRANAPRRPPRPAPVHDLYGSARKTPPKRSVRNNNTALLGAIGFVGLLGLLLILFALLHTPQDAGRRGDAGVEELVGE